MPFRRCPCWTPEAGQLCAPVDTLRKADGRKRSLGVDENPLLGVPRRQSLRQKIRRVFDQNQRGGFEGLDEARRQADGYAVANPEVLAIATVKLNVFRREAIG
jgi:hypothetical protein